MNAFTSVFREFRSGEGLKAQLLRGGVGSLGVSIAAKVVALLGAVILSRALGTHGYGIYAYALALVSLLAIPADFGLSTLVLRETAKAYASGAWGMMRGVWRFAALMNLLGIAIVVVPAILIVLAIADRFTEEMRATLLLGFAAIPLIVLGKLRGAALRGLGKAVIGQLPELLIKNVLLVFFVLTFFAFPQVPFEAPIAMALNVAAAALAFLAGALLLYFARPTPLTAKPKPVYQLRHWMAALAPLALLPAVQYVKLHTDIVMLGMFRPAAEVGVYAVAAGGAALVAFGVDAVNKIVAPQFARLYENGDREKLQRLAVISARAGLALALPIALLCWLFGSHILEFVFGAGFGEGAAVLAVLTLGQVIHAATGMPGVLLIMSPHAGEALKANLLAAGANVLLNLMLIPPFGLMGACMATLITVLIWKISLWRIAQLKTGCDCSIVGLRG